MTAWPLWRDEIHSRKGKPVLRILHLLPRLSGGGAERQFAYLAPELAVLGHEVHAAYLDDGPERPALPGVIMHPLTAANNHDPRLLWRLCQLTRRLRPDIIQTWIPQMDVLGSFAAKLHRIPCVFREASSGLGFRPTWKHRLRVWAARWTSAIVSNSQGGATFWSARLPAARRLIIRNGLPLSEIERVPAALPAGYRDPEVPVVLSVGRLVADGPDNKHVGSFLEALARVKKGGPVCGFICGTGPQRRELELWRRKLGLDETVCFTGHVKAAVVWSLMKRATVFVSLSAYEGCPNSVMEAMACGCPLIVSDIPGHREILDAHSALFVAPQDVARTADAIAQTLRDPTAARTRAVRAKQKTLAWSTASMARNYEQLYGQLLSTPRTQHHD